MGLRSSVIEMRCPPLLRVESPQIRLAINVIIFFVMYFLENNNIVYQKVYIHIDSVIKLET